MTEKFPSLVKNINLQIQESSVTPRQDKSKKTHPQVYHNQTDEKWRQKKKILKANNKSNDCKILLRNHKG